MGNFKWGDDTPYPRTAPGQGLATAALFGAGGPLAGLGLQEGGFLLPLPSLSRQVS